MKYLLLLPLLMACNRPHKPKSPPIEDGKCLVDKYIGTLEMTQTCNYVGYSWSCQLNTASGIDECTRGGEVAGERAPAVLK